MVKVNGVIKREPESSLVQNCQNRLEAPNSVPRLHHQITSCPSLQQEINGGTRAIINQGNHLLVYHS